MNKCVRTRFSLASLIVFSISILSVTGQQTLGPPTQQSHCMTEKQHNILIDEIKSATRTFGKQLSNKTTKSIVLFDWPVQANPSLDFYNYYCVTNYVDHNPAVGSENFNQFGNTNLDYNCGNTTYDQSSGYNHQGIDIALWPFAWHIMENDLVEVIAAQSGTIIVNVDGNYDLNCGSIPTGSVANRIVIQHQDNSRSIYLHLKNGSLTTKPVGSTVLKGEYLGVVGSSGFSSAPHLHFEVIDENFNLIDPYFGACNSMNNNSWWANQPVYKDPQINALLTHSPWPVHSQCPASTEQLNATNCFANGQLLRLGIYWRDMVVDMNTSIVVKDPSNNIYNSASHDGIGTFPCYWWTFNLGNLPPGGPYGNWTIEATFNGQLYRHNFEYTATLPCSNCTDYISETGNNPITQNASAAINISTDGTIASGLSIDYKAGQSLDFLGGFNVAQGAVFHGYITPCL